MLYRLRITRRLPGIAFTMNLDTGPTALSMVRAIIAIARAPGLRIVTEGVENSTQVEILRRLGSDEIQGYYCGQPESGGASVARVLRQLRSSMSAQTPMPLVDSALHGGGDLIAIEAAITQAQANFEDSLQPSSAPRLP
jgi:hypothetical protein